MGNRGVRYMIELVILFQLWSLNTGYEMEIYSSMFRKFVSISPMNHIVLHIELEYSMSVGFFNKTVLITGIRIERGGYAIGSQSFVTLPELLPETGFTIWITWMTGTVTFGEGEKLGTNTFSQFQLNTSAVDYVAFSSFQSFATTLNFPDFAVYDASNGRLLSTAPVMTSSTSCLSCGRRCLADPLCYAFNYRQSTPINNCELIESVDVNGVIPFEPISDSEWRYYFLKV